MVTFIIILEKVISRIPLNIVEAINKQIVNNATHLRLLQRGLGAIPLNHHNDEFEMNSYRCTTVAETVDDLHSKFRYMMTDGGVDTYTALVKLSNMRVILHVFDCRTMLLCVFGRKPIFGYYRINRYGNDEIHLTGEVFCGSLTPEVHKNMIKAVNGFMPLFRKSLGETI